MSKIDLASADWKNSCPSLYNKNIISIYMVNKIADHYECPIDKHIYRFIDEHLSVYNKLGFSPNMITTLSIIACIVTGYQIFQSNYFVAAIFWLIAYYFDCVDGKLARKYNMTSNFGDMYDHFSDILKYIIVFYALFYSSTKRTTDKQWIYIAIIMFISLLTLVHLGYQEYIYNKKEESSLLNIYKVIFVSFDDNPHRTIQYTKYFGSGTWIFSVLLLIIIWSK